MAETDYMRWLLPLMRNMAKEIKPIVQLTPEGIHSIGGGELRRGRLMAITPCGSLRVRKFGCKTVNTYHPQWWEISESQEPERTGDR